MKAGLIKAHVLAAGLIVAGTGTAFAAGNAQQPTICERACWGARTPSGSISTISALTRGVIHHTAGASDYDTTSQASSIMKVRAIQNYHMDTNGWSDIGYHFLVDKLGNRFEGRQGSMGSLPRGAHDGVNTNSFGYNIMGYYHTPYNQVPTLESRSALYDIIAWRQPNGWSPYGGSAYGSNSNAGVLCGHRDAAATACPGDLLYAYIGTNLNGGEARDEVNNRINGGTPPNATIVDNVGAAYVEAGGWATGASAGYGDGTYRYATAGTASDATWTASLPAAGYYTVSVIYYASTNRSTGAAYEVSTASGTANASVNQTVNSMSWVDLGTYQFNAGNAAVKLNAATSTAGSGIVVIADAVKFTETTPPAPNAPSSLTATVISKSQINLAWADNSSDETNFVVERKTGTGAYSVIATLGANTTAYNNTGLASNTTYTYRVKATNANGSSAYSNEASGKTLRK